MCVCVYCKSSLVQVVSNFLSMLYSLVFNIIPFHLSRVLSISLKIIDSLQSKNLDYVSPVNFTQSSFCLQHVSPPFCLICLFLCRSSELHLSLSCNSSKCRSGCSFGPTLLAMDGMRAVPSLCPPSLHARV